MHDQLLSGDAGINADARKQHLHMHLSNLDAASTVVQRCKTLKLYAQHAISHETSDAALQQDGQDASANPNLHPGRQMIVSTSLVFI